MPDFHKSIIDYYPRKIRFCQVPSLPLFSLHLAAVCLLQNINEINEIFFALLFKHYNDISYQSPSIFQPDKAQSLAALFSKISLHYTHCGKQDHSWLHMICSFAKEWLGKLFNLPDDTVSSASRHLPTLSKRPMHCRTLHGP